MGAAGEDVKTLQTALGIKPDGDFGPGTKTAVLKAQKAAGLSQDGVVGKSTWAAILH